MEHIIGRPEGLPPKPSTGARMRGAVATQNSIQYIYIYIERDI